ncbi:MAG TPA: hypothetical protein VJY35_10715 [Candidatus Eisenbacteria bacterium]|nr:hypothetical protein [Candidatus Eisenbacteria bacterium]
MATGDLFDVQGTGGPGGDLRTITLIQFGAMNASGEIVLRLDFDDGRSGHYHVSPAGPVAVEPPAGRCVVFAQNAPNPFARSTRFDFELPAAGRVALNVFDASGVWCAACSTSRVPRDARRSIGAAAAATAYNRAEMSQQPLELDGESGECNRRVVPPCGRAGSGRIGALRLGCFALVLTSMLAFPRGAFARPNLPPNALPQTVRLHLASWHDRAGFNNANLGAALLWNGGLAVGGFANSYGRPSWYGGLVLPVLEVRAFRLELMTGVITGYSESSPVDLVAVPSLGWRLSPRSTLQVVIMPRVVIPANVVHVMFERRFGAREGDPAR